MNNNNFSKYKENRKVLDILTLSDNLKYDKNKKVSIAILIPHRKRIEHLKKFISWTDKLEKSPNHIYDIYLIDQNNFDRFNRGLLINIGFYIAKKNNKYDRYILHDVDSYPSQELFDLYFSELDKNIHFASPYLGYKYNFYTFYGGVSGFKGNDFEKINGFPLNFFGWGGEDDSLFDRSVVNDLKVFRPSKGSYVLEDHPSPVEAELNKQKKDNILYDLKNWKKNGLHQLEDLYINYKQYEINSFIENYYINDPNSVNNAEFLYNYKPNKSNKNNKNNIYVFKIDYLAMHFKTNSILLPKNFVEKKISEKIEEKFKDINYFQHKTKPIYISVIEPLIYWDEIKEKIINTFTKPKKFELDIKTNKRTDKINDILKNEFSNYSNLSVDDLEKTIKFIFENYNELVYIRVRNNKIECSYHIYGETTKVDWFKNLKYKSKPIDTSIINILEDTGKNYYTVKNPHNMSVNNCLLGLDSYNYFEGNPYSYIKSFIEMINYTIKKFKHVPDCDLLLDRKDFAYLRKDDKYGYNHILDEKIENPLKKYWVVGCQSKKKINYEIPIPSADEWEGIKNKTKYETKWEDKHSVAVFRGSSTGCGNTDENNQRMKLSQISYDINNKNNKNNNNNFLNVALSQITRRVKVYKSNINIIDQEKYKHLLGSFLDGMEQSKNKYIFNVEGNAQAYRYPTEFRKKSVILNVKSEFYMWFEPLLKNNKHIVEVDLDKDNVETIVTDLIKNDKKAEKIARNGYRFFKKYINKKMIAYYWLYYMNNVNNLSCY